MHKEKLDQVERNNVQEQKSIQALPQRSVLSICTSDDTNLMKNKQTTDKLFLKQ